MTRESRLIVAWLLCSSVAVIGCQEDSSDSSSGGSGCTGECEPSLTVRAASSVRGCTNVLPVATVPELREDSFLTAEVTVTGVDPNRSSLSISPGTGVTIYVGDAEGSPVAAEEAIGGFLSSREPGTPGANPVSTNVTFAGANAEDSIYCTREGIMRVHAIIEDYDGEGQVRSDAARGFPITCMNRLDWLIECDQPLPQCADGEDNDGDGLIDTDDDGCSSGLDDDEFVEPPDAGMVDAGIADASLVDAGGIDADLPPEQSIIFESASNESLEIGIRGSRRADRIDTIDLRFQVTVRGDPPTDPIKIVFGPGDDPPPGIEVTAVSAFANQQNNGIVTARLRAGSTPGQVGVQACIENLDIPEDQWTCAITPPIDILAGIPSGLAFDFSCEHPWIPAFDGRDVTLDPDGDPFDTWFLANVEGTRCFAFLADRLSGRVDPGTSVTFLTEAGTTNANANTDGEGVAEMVLRVQEPAPFDVGTRVDEVCVAVRDPNGNDLAECDDQARSPFDPRDAWVTLVAATRGEEAFVDTDGDRAFNPQVDYQLPEQKLGEPFVDANDNGQWDCPGGSGGDDDIADDACEPFTDLDRDGVRTEADEEWDADTVIWEETRVIWLGLFHPRRSGMNVQCDPADRDFWFPPEVGVNTPDPSGSCGATDLPGGQARSYRLSQGGSAEVWFRFADVNGNCLGGRDQGTVTVTVDTAGVEVQPVQFRNQRLPDQCGIDVFRRAGGARLVTGGFIRDTRDPTQAADPDCGQLLVSGTYIDPLTRNRQFSGQHEVCTAGIVPPEMNAP